MSARLAAVLAKARLARKVGLKVVLGNAPEERHQRPLGPWLFYPDLGPTPTEKGVQRVYKRALAGMRRSLEKAGLPTYFFLHSLRHSYGSGLISRGVSPAFVMQQMGHASIKQTVDTYGSWLPIQVPGAVDALAEATAPGSRGHQMDTDEVLEAAEVH